ncbi:MAG TPA: hypothetical protein VHL80_21260 [Polyangia bacterium]|nr:hypothetical protein [Polyangia bacterium]
MNAARRWPRRSARPPVKHASLRVAQALLVVACALGAGACSRAHITPSHGRAFHEAFAIQDANPGRGKAKSVNGLDSQEAAIIAGNYRKALAPKSDNAGNNGQLLMVSPNHGGAAEVPVAPAPSGP